MDVDLFLPWSGSNKKQMKLTTSFDSCYFHNENDDKREKEKKTRADNPLVVINPERPTHCVGAAARHFIFNSNVGKY